jgi:DNA-binding NarL/FixJ family response regulator
VIQKSNRAAVGKRQRTFAGEGQMNVNYWLERLIHRPYGMQARHPANRELSVRIAREGVSNYFPLGTSDPDIAASQALRIHRIIVERGWETAREQFNREVTLAFHWIDNPLAWTYTTINTRPPAENESDIHVLPQAGRIPAAVIEYDSGVRQSLAWCLNQMEGFYCAATFRNASRARAALAKRRVQLILLNQGLAESSEFMQWHELKLQNAGGACLGYSIYPDSEGLFASTPGGAVCYLLRRRQPTKFLEPIHDVPAGVTLSHQELTSRAWLYFKQLFASRPAADTAQASPGLTQREHEVLALLSNGHPDKEIADKLSISIYTVHGHVRNIFEKLGVHNRTEAVVRYLQK